MKKILRIITRMNVGGPSRHVTILARGLRDHGYETTLVFGKVSPHEGSMEYLCREAGIEVIKVDSLVREINPLQDWRARRDLAHLIRDIRPDIVHTHLAKAGYAGRMAAASQHVPTIVHTYHGHTFSGYFGPVKSAVFRMLERRAGRRSDGIVALGAAQKHDISEVYRIVPPEKVHIIPLGLELAPMAALDPEADPTPARMALGVPTEGKLVSIVGRIVPVKNHDLFIDAARLITQDNPEVHFCVVGRGELEEHLRARIAEAGLTQHMHLVGWRQDMPTVYAASDVVMLTSLNEGSPVALIEAQAAATPVVSTRVGGVADTVEHERTGLLCPEGDASCLARSTLSLLNDEAMARRMGLAGRAWATSEFSARVLVERTDALYRKLAD